MNDLFNSLISYYREAQFDSLSFWAFPFCTILFIWLLTLLGLKIFTKRRRLKTVFVANRAWMISSLIAAGLIIGLICFWWSQNFFSHNPLQLSLLVSLIIALLVPVFSLMNVRSYYTEWGIKEITDQPKTMRQLDKSIRLTKKEFSRNKLYFFVPVFGFLLLLLYFYKGTNLIALVYDNSGSMTQTTAIDALSETFEKLQENNEITFTTLDGFTSPDDPAGKNSMNELMLVSKSSALKGGHVVAFNNPQEARTGLLQGSRECFGSPISESIWKTFLFIQETKAIETYKNKILVIITDGLDDIDGSLSSGKFFFDDEGFSEYFSPNDVFIIDYSNGTSSSFMQRFQNSGCDAYPAENKKQDYLDALDNALQSFKNNWYLIYWAIVILGLFTIIGLLIQPKKII